MRALIDTNIFLDVALARPGSARSGELLDRLEDIPLLPRRMAHDVEQLLHPARHSPAAARRFLSDVLDWAMRPVATGSQASLKLPL
jgi:predicted nucleic acid-binding protein